MTFLIPDDVQPSFFWMIGMDAAILFEKDKQ
jgi:hypothetical protein